MHVATRRESRLSVRRQPRGFTLLELLVVLVIAGITIGLASFQAMPDQRQVLQGEAQRIALLLQLARDEAILRNTPIAFEAETGGYRFLLRSGNNWQKLIGDEVLRERDYAHPPIALTMVPGADSDGSSLRIIFGREPVDRPFVLTLAAGDARVAIHADGIGHYAVE